MGRARVMMDGNIGKAPTLRMSQAGTPILSFSLAVNDTYKNQAGERQRRTDWFRCTVFGKRARGLYELLTSGRYIGVDGRLSTRNWEDQEGVRQYRTEVIVDQVHFHGPGKKAAEAEEVPVDDTPVDVQLPPDPDELDMDDAS